MVLNGHNSLQKFIRNKCMANIMLQMEKYMILHGNIYLNNI